MKESLVFLTDLHLERMHYKERGLFIRDLSKRKEEIIAIGGDIALALSTPLFLSELANACPSKKICFVLGNHDCYGDSVARMKRILSHMCRHYSNLLFLDDGKIIQIEGTNTCIIGESGWADARSGLKERTFAKCPDFEFVHELKKKSRAESFQAMRDLADNSAAHLNNTLQKAASLGFKHFVVVTHVPPFHEAVWFQGEKNSPVQMPYYVDVAMGRMLIAFAKMHRSRKITVLSGHTHSPYRGRVAKNIEICVGAPRVPLIMK